MMVWITSCGESNPMQFQRPKNQFKLKSKQNAQPFKDVYAWIYIFEHYYKRSKCFNKFQVNVIW
jgi:hypothetical protein